MDTHLLKKNALTEVVHIIPKYSLLNETDVSKTVCVCEEGDTDIYWFVELSMIGPSCVFTTCF